MKLKKGYRPWVARKAPLFTHSLNETYIKASALLPIVIISALLGVAIGLTSERGLPNLNLSQKKPVLSAKNKEEPAKSFEESIDQIQVEVPVLVPIDNNYQTSNTVKVPAIPMQNSESMSTGPTLTAK